MNIYINCGIFSFRTVRDFTTMGLNFYINRCTHRYLIEPMSKVLLSSRYVTFYRSLILSDILLFRGA